MLTMKTSASTIGKMGQQKQNLQEVNIIICK